MLTKWIISRIPNHEDVKNERVRSAYGKAASLWNNAFLTYRDYRARTAVPEGGASALRLC